MFYLQETSGLMIALCSILNRENDIYSKLLLRFSQRTSCYSSFVLITALFLLFFKKIMSFFDLGLENACHLMFVFKKS
jgi:hypothetical protein